jgi:hypothetical protein
MVGLGSAVGTRCALLLLLLAHRMLLRIAIEAWPKAPFAQFYSSTRGDPEPVW